LVERSTLTHAVRFTRSASGFLFFLRETLDGRRETLVVKVEKPGEFGRVAIIDLDIRFLDCSSLPGASREAWKRDAISLPAYCASACATAVL
jgi:hypothetical protein